MCTIARTQCGDDVAQSAQTLIDCLGFFEAVFIVCRTTRRKPFRSSQILHALISSAPRREGKGKRTYDQIQTTLTRLASDPVRAAYTQCKDGM